VLRQFPRVVPRFRRAHLASNGAASHRVLKGERGRPNPGADRVRPRSLGGGCGRYVVEMRRMIPAFLIAPWQTRWRKPGGAEANGGLLHGPRGDVQGKRRSGLGPNGTEKFLATAPDETHGVRRRTLPLIHGVEVATDGALRPHVRGCSGRSRGPKASRIAVDGHIQRSPGRRPWKIQSVPSRRRRVIRNRRSSSATSAVMNTVRSAWLFGLHETSPVRTRWSPARRALPL